VCYTEKKSASSTTTVIPSPKPTTDLPIENLSPKEIFDDNRAEQRHRKELEDLISDARKRTEPKKVENNEAPNSSNAENSKNDESGDTISDTSDLSLAKTTSLVSISSQGSSVEIIEPVMASKSNTLVRNNDVVHANLVSLMQAPTSSAPIPIQSQPKSHLPIESFEKSGLVFLERSGLYLLIF